jgi:hypothetical protein
MKIKNAVDVFGDNMPKVVGIVADPHQGKSNTIYFLIEEIQRRWSTTIFTYGLRGETRNTQKVSSVEQLETLRNSVIFIDEFYTLFEMDNRKKTPLIEKTLRRIFWSNNMLVLCGLPQNFNKFISGKLSHIFFKQCTLVDFINGSRVKNVALSYREDELGSAMLCIPKDKALVYEAESLTYSMVHIPYLKQQDMKLLNPPIMEKR